MKRLLRWAIGVMAILLVLLIAAILARDVVLKAVTARSIEEETGLRAVIGELKTTLGSTAVRVRGLKLYNSAEFGGTLMADVPELLVDLDAEQAADGRLHFRNLKLVLSELNIVRNAAGRLNIDGVEKRIRERLVKRRKKKGEKFRFEFAGIDRMHLTVGTVFYADLKRFQRPLSFDLAVKDEVVTGLDTEEDLQKWAGAMISRILVQVLLGQLASVPDGGTHH